MIGRRPKRSENTPSKGEKTNCISAKTTANRALHFAASVISPPRKSRISFGKTGMIKPIARMSRVTVTRMKIIAAGRDFMRVEHERNVVAAGVSTTGVDGTARAVGGVFLSSSRAQDREAWVKQRYIPDEPRRVRSLLPCGQGCPRL